MAKLLLLLAYLGVGLQPTPPLVWGEPFTVLFDHTVRYYQAAPVSTDPPVLCQTAPPGPACTADTTSYGLLIDGATVQTITVGQPLSFRVTAGLSAGPHTVAVVASNAATFTSSTALAMVIDIGPPGPQSAPTVARTPPPPQPSALTVTPLTGWVGGTSTVSAPAVSAQAEDLLVVPVAIDGGTGTATVTSVPPLTWTSRVAGGSGSQAIARIYTAPVATASSVVVTLAVTGATYRAVAVFAARGAHQTVPVGAAWTATSSTNNWTPTTYTSTVAGSRGFAVGVDFAGLGLPTSTDVATSHTFNATGGRLSYLAVHKSAATAATGAPVPFNFNAFGTASASWRGVAIELRPR